ncbi:MAG: hypothetical protein ACJ71P_04730 [Nitrososphaeraceae archaeon]
MQHVSSIYCNNVINMLAEKGYGLGVGGLEQIRGGAAPAVLLADGVPVVLACCVPAVIIPGGAAAGLAGLFP